MKNLITIFQRHQKTIILTFKLFWIVIFLLEMLGNKSGSGIPQFVYVNF